MILRPLLKRVTDGYSTINVVGCNRCQLVVHKRKSGRRHAITKLKRELIVVYDPQHVLKWQDPKTRPEGVDFPAVVIGDRLLFSFFHG